MEGQGYDIYLSLNPTTFPGIKPSREHIMGFRAFLLDLDARIPQCESAAAMWELLGEAERLVPGVSDAATIVDSGRGAQAWISFASDAGPDIRTMEGGISGFLHTLHREWAERHGYEVDTTTSDASRIVRCPGTINTRSGRRATITKHTTNTIRPEVFEHFAAVHRVGEGNEKVLVAPTEGKRWKLVDLLPHLNGTASEYLCAGVDVGNRHHNAFATAKALQECGVAFESACYWVLYGAEKCRPKLGRGDALHAVEEAYGG